jgi:vancomycin permeability regulator SanA
MGKVVRWILTRIVSVAVSLIVLVIGGSWLVIHGMSNERTFPPASVPSRNVTLVFGASMWEDGPSPYLQARLDIAVQLYLTGKTEVIIVSGTQDGGYSEPDGMKAALIAAGVPAQRIVTDVGGDDTYTSCVHARDTFGLHSLIVVTQDYHLPRAIASCRLAGVDAVGVADTERERTWQYHEYQVRELGANLKLLYDVLSQRNIPTPAASAAVSEALDYPR